MEFFAKDGRIYQGDQPISIKGINWFGFETSDYALHGLWSVNLEKTLDFVAAAGFNAIRMPFSCELALDMEGKKPTSLNTWANKELVGVTSGQLMDRFIASCASRGLLVMLDMHRLEGAGSITELWYDSRYTEDKVIQAWKIMVTRYLGCWNVFAADLKNEPHGAASWGDGVLATDWRLAAERIGAAVQEINPRLLIFVEGVEKNGVVQPQENCWWGGSIASAEKAPVRLPIPNKLVYSPHVYGPDVHMQPYFEPADFLSNMEAIWDRHFGFAKKNALGPAVCLGEWGGWARVNSKDLVWHKKLSEYIAANKIDSFYWCLNPDSGDTGGVLTDDWVTPNETKLEIIAKAHPNPTLFPKTPVTLSLPAATVSRKVPPVTIPTGPSLTSVTPVVTPGTPDAGGEFFAKNGRIYRGDQLISIKGINWFGFETTDYGPHGLWSVNLEETLDFVAAAGFNAIRLPFSCELALDMEGKKPTSLNTWANKELVGVTSGQLMDRFIASCASRGLLVMLDMHRLEGAGSITELWYDSRYTEDKVIQAWKIMVTRYLGCWNVFAADLKNEPHGAASWGDGVLATDWRLAAERIGAAVQEINPRLLIFVEGVEKNGVVQPQENCWWGGSIASAEKAPVRLPIPNKLVYSPHMYGPEVHMQPYFEPADFLSNMEAIWDRHFGFVKKNALGPALCTGEWGGKAADGSKDQAWLRAIADYFAKNEIDTFYWCLNPDSGDTGGVLTDDWVTPNKTKLDIIAKAHPHPTKFNPAPVPLPKVFMPAPAVAGKKQSPAPAGMSVVEVV